METLYVEPEKMVIQHPYQEHDARQNTEGRLLHMYTLSAKLTFYIPYATSLKDKRQICRSLIDKTRQRFNVSIAEVDTQDIYQTLTIGVAVVSGKVAHAQNSLDEIVRYVEEHTDAELQEVER